MGRIEGVVATRPGWLQEMEVVEVTYDPRRVTLKDLIRQAESCRCALRVFTRTDAQQAAASEAIGERAVRSDEAVRPDDDKYYTSRTPLRYLPMTPMQATAVNAYVGEKKDVGTLLAPSQQALLDVIRSHPDAGWSSAIGVAFADAWASATKRAAALK